MILINTTNKQIYNETWKFEWKLYPQKNNIEYRLRSWLLLRAYVSIIAYTTRRRTKYIKTCVWWRSTFAVDEIGISSHITLVKMIKNDSELCIVDYIVT